MICEYCQGEAKVVSINGEVACPACGGTGTRR